LFCKNVKTARLGQSAESGDALWDLGENTLSGIALQEYFLKIKREKCPVLFNFLCVIRYTGKEIFAKMY